MMDELTVLENLIQLRLQDYDSNRINRMIETIKQLPLTSIERTNEFCELVGFTGWIKGRINRSEINIMSLLEEAADRQFEYEKEGEAEDDVIKQNKRLWNHKGF